MDDQTFAHQLATWLDPMDLMECVHQHETNRDHALAPAELVVASGRLNSGDEGNYAELVRMFLRGFRVPPAVVDLMRRFQGSPGFSEESWRWLAELTISGTVRVCSHGNVPEGLPPHTILLVEERDVVVDLVRAPVLALLDLVDRLAFGWRQMAALSTSIYHQPDMPTPFYAYVDSQVAAAFLPLVSSLHLTGTSGPKFRYRAVTVWGRADPADPIWELTQKTARETAARTHQSIPRETL